MSIDGPGTIDDLVDDAAAAGHRASVRLVRDWTELGLLDSPTPQPAGKGHGSHKALYVATQRWLFLALLDKREQTSRLQNKARPPIKGLARVVFYIWIYLGDGYIPLRQARKVLMTWLGSDPRLSKDLARATARTTLGHLDHPNASATSRRRLLDTLTNIAWTGRMDSDQLRQAVQAVFEPDGAPRSLGHPNVAITTDTIIQLIETRWAAIEALREGNIDDEQFIRARQRHLIHFVEYAALQPQFAARAPQQLANLFGTPTEQQLADTCCIDFLTALGFETTTTQAEPPSQQGDESR